MHDTIVLVEIILHIIEQVCASTSHTRWATYQRHEASRCLTIKEVDLNLYIKVDNLFDLELFLNGARWARSMIRTIRSSPEKFKYVSISSQELEEIKSMPSPYKSHIILNTHEHSQLFEATPYDLLAIQKLLSACSAAPWHLSIEGLDHVSGSDLLYNNDHKNIEIISTNHMDIVYTMKINTYLNIITRILNH